MTDQLHLPGLSVSYGPYGYWAAVGLLAGMGRGSLHWDVTGTPVVSGVDADEIEDWLRNDWTPRPICSPWNGRAPYRSPRLAGPLGDLGRQNRANLLIDAIDVARSQWPEKPATATERQTIKQYLWGDITHSLNRWCRACNLPGEGNTTVYNRLFGSGGNNASMDVSYQYVLCWHALLCQRPKKRVERWTEWINQLIRATPARGVRTINPGLLANIPTEQNSFLPVPLALAIEGLWWCAPHQPSGMLWRREWPINTYPHQYPTSNVAASLSMPTLSPPAGTTQSDQISAMITMPLWGEQIPISQVVALLAGTTTAVEPTAYAVYSTPVRAGQSRIVCYQGNRPATDPEIKRAREYQRKALPL